MSRIRNCLTVTAGAAAGLFLGALASSVTANADTVPINPGLPAMFEQVVASSATIPQQLLQTTSSALSGTSLAPAASPAQAPLATATFNVPPSPSALNPAAPATPAGLPGLSGFPANLTSLLPFPLPNLGGTAPVAAVSTATMPGAVLPSTPMTAVTPPAVMLIPGLP
ncbi:MAG: hypothetical protein ABI253_16275 [Mycobacterium sp.]